MPAYPAKPVNENSGDVKTLKDVKNFLYVIDGSKFKSKEKYLEAMAENKLHLLVIDPFTKNQTVTPDQLKPLKAKANGGRRFVLCYVSIGQARITALLEERLEARQSGLYRPGRPGLERQLRGEVLGTGLASDLSRRQRLYLARVQAAGFDGIYLDRVDYFEWFEEHGE